eukprot:CFRG2578T1
MNFKREQSDLSNDEDHGTCIPNDHVDSKKPRIDEADDVDDVEGSDECDDEDDEDALPFLSRGPKDAEGNLHGNCLQLYLSGDIFVGQIDHGAKTDRGQFYYADGSILRATFEDDIPVGEVQLFPNGDTSELIVGTYMDGRIEGKQFIDGDLVYEGWFVEDRYAAEGGTFYLQGGGRLSGSVHEQSQEVNGKDVTYVYPCGYMALHGEWVDGQLQTCTYGPLISQWDITTYHSSETWKDEYTLNVSTESVISATPMRAEPWESDRVYMKESIIPGANDGLFAKKDFGAYEVVSFYNGIRLTHEEVDSRDWDLNSNTITLNSDSVIDVPAPYDKTTHYKNTLGHKANHSQNPNAMYDCFFHPVFGDIKCIRTICPVKENEEILVNYGYTHETVPDWYKAVGN